jgi:hypothetical protein
MAKPAIVLVQEFTYRGAREQYSNKYHFAGPAPGDAASWLTLSNSIWNVLKSCFPANTTHVASYGYTDGDNPSVWSHDYTVPGPPPTGTLPAPTGWFPPGDTAAWVRWTTDKRNSKGKIVYCRKYFHQVAAKSANENDEVAADQHAQLQAFAQTCVDGTISSVFHVCTPDGHLGSAPAVGTYLTTRTLKRRGKRPPT